MKEVTEVDQELRKALNLFSPGIHNGIGKNGYTYLHILAYEE